MHAAGLFWLDSIWLSELVDDEGRVDIIRMKESMNSPLTEIPIEDMLLPVCETLKLARIKQYGMVLDAFRAHRQANTKLTINAIRSICPDVKDILAAAAVLDTISEIADCMRLEVGVITDQIFLTALMMNVAN
jgi:hypothetical protein